MNRFLSFVPLAALTFVIVGCTESTTEEAPEPADETAQTQATPPQPGTTGNSGVQIHTGGAGGIAPVTGTENLQGSGGGGVNQAAKSQAQKAAAQAGGSSLDQLGDY